MLLFSGVTLFIVSGLVAFVSAQSNPISSPTSNDTLTTGQAFLVKWTPSNDHPISLFLLHGQPSNLQLVLTIITNLTNAGIVRWTPPTSIYTENDYTLSIEDDVTGDVNYSNQFAIKGLNPSSSSSTSSTSSSSLAPSTSSTTSSSSTSSSATSSTTSSSSISLSSLAVRSANVSTTSLLSWTNSSSVLTTSSSTSTLQSIVAASSTTSSASAAATTIRAINDASRSGSANSVIALVSIVFSFFLLV
ncbi:Ser-Thr-rich glycosyl-phosphatidyl-inositol-anchored membrane family-domain-containing protein [Lipomyces kononenkoae]|uniref:Ser-Thr-rich glycosyl-phosphatidyl-inositol-anchored membrane family-domain-containing protein n=1 Tax=Lipomyces kononenkoae TaxID=34357 RepID=A0ACC3T114_LIPKO